MKMELILITKLKKVFKQAIIEHAHSFLYIIKNFDAPETYIKLAEKFLIISLPF